MYIADTQNNRIRRVSSGGIITTVAGSGTPGFSGVSGDGGQAIRAGAVVWFTSFFEKVEKDERPKRFIYLGRAISHSEKMVECEFCQLPCYFLSEIRAN